MWQPAWRPCRRCVYMEYYWSLWDRDTSSSSRFWCLSCETVAVMIILLSKLCCACISWAGRASVWGNTVPSLADYKWHLKTQANWTQSWEFMQSKVYPYWHIFHFAIQQAVYLAVFKLSTFAFMTALGTFETSLLDTHASSPILWLTRKEKRSIMLLPICINYLFMHWRVNFSLEITLVKQAGVQTQSDSKVTSPWVYPG